MVKGLVELHGGSVSVESAGAGLGTHARVALPLSAVPDAVAPGETPADGGALRVVVVEDNVDAAETLREALEIEGHVVAVAFDGRSGLEALRQFRPHVAICDIGLPGDMDGYDLARAVKADPALRATPLVALTGYAGPEDQRRAKDAGFARHFAKPADLAVLLDTIRRFAPP
jgi:two-component system CheB/CheR fusion protein